MGIGISLSRVEKIGMLLVGIFYFYNFVQKLLLGHIYPKYEKKQKYSFLDKHRGISKGLKARIHQFIIHNSS